MTQELMTYWFKKHFINEAKEHIAKIGMLSNSKILLLLDNCPAHPPAEELFITKLYFADSNYTDT